MDGCDRLSSLRQAPASDDTQTSAAVPSSRLVSEVGATCPTGLCSGQHAAGPAARAVTDVRVALPHPGWERATDERAVRVARPSVRRSGRRLRHALGHGRVWCPRSESEKPSRDAGFRAKLQPKTPCFHLGFWTLGLLHDRAPAGLGLYLHFWQSHIGSHGERPIEEWPAILKELADKRIVSRGYPHRFVEEVGNRPSLHPRPGLVIARAWPLSEAEQLNSNGELPSAVRSAADHVLALIGERPLHARRGSPRQAPMNLPNSSLLPSMRSATAAVVDGCSVDPAGSRQRYPSRSIWRAGAVRSRNARAR